MKHESDTQEHVIPTQICLPREMILALDVQAKRENLFRGRSIIVRRAVAEYLQRHGNATCREPYDELMSGRRIKQEPNHSPHEPIVAESNTPECSGMEGAAHD